MKSLLLEGGFESWGMLLVLLIFVVVLIVPTFIRNKKENAKRQEVMSQLKAGDSIITTAGVFGKIISVRETTIGKVFVIETGDEKHKSYQEIHADAIMGVDTKRDIILDANGNDITFAEEDKKELEAKEEKVEDKKEDVDQLIEETLTKSDKKKTRKSTK